MFNTLNVNIKMLLIVGEFEHFTESILYFFAGTKCSLSYKALKTLRTFLIVADS